MDVRLRGHFTAVLRDVQACVLSGLSFHYVDEHTTDILWLSLAQRLFDSWFEYVYFWTPRRRWSRRTAGNWALIPIRIDDEIYDWPIRKLDWQDYRPYLRHWRSARDLSNAFQLWQRAVFQLNAQRLRAQEIWSFLLLPLAELHGAPDSLMLTILPFLGPYENLTPVTSWYAQRVRSTRVSIAL